MSQPEGFVRMYRERFIMALAQKYCASQITWEEYARTVEVVQVVMRSLEDELAEARSRQRDERAS